MEIRCFPLHFSVFPFTLALNTSGGRIPQIRFLYCVIQAKGRTWYAPFFPARVN